MNLSLSDKIDLYLQKGLELLDRLYRDMIENNIRWFFVILQKVAWIQSVLLLLLLL